ncbi:DUF397 domain-containing protein [Streptomyces sp. NPDC090303]|uniref:DUF397 domain-containing protein n=1 Tax=Streptomyces sp. NPDC090303 TaxID=3365960 RepID=UPI00381F3B67
MRNYGNGVPASSIEGAAWHKARASDAVGNCVEVAKLGNGDVAMRNSRHPDGPALVFTRAEVEAFLQGARGGEFDSVTI